MDGIPWPLELKERDGSPVLLSGISVFYDFDWFDRFDHDRAAFPNGKPLAARAKELGKGGKTPGLLLTELPNERLRTWSTGPYELLVVNIEKYQKYLESAANAADAFLGKGADVDIANLAKDIDLTATQISQLIDRRLEPEIVKAWAEADPGRLAETIQLLTHLDGGMDAAVAGRERDVLKALHRLGGDEFWQALKEAGIDLPDALAHRKVWQSRTVALNEFRLQLEEKEWDEPHWQEFFESNDWIFGHTLSHRFLWLEESQPYVGGQGVSGSGGQKSDFLYRTAAAVRFTALVEIKTPQTQLLGRRMKQPDRRAETGLAGSASSADAPRPYRNHTYGPSGDLAGAITQVQQQTWRWAVVGSRDEPDLEDRRIYTYAPHGILVIGHSESLVAGSGEETRDMLRSFEVFRRNLVEPEVLTYDEIFYRAEQVVTNGLGN